MQFSPVVNPSAKIYPEPEETRNPNKRENKNLNMNACNKEHYIY